MKRDKRMIWQPINKGLPDISGYNIAVFGGTGGIGRALSKKLALHGENVSVVGQTFRDEGVERLNFMRADLSLMHEAERVARELPAEHLDMVIFTTVTSPLQSARKLQKVLSATLR